MSFGFRSPVYGPQLTWTAVVVNLIGATRTKTGLRVKAILDTNEYETGIAVSKEQMAGLAIRRHKKHPDWNYTLSPRIV